MKSRFAAVVVSIVSALTACHMVPPAPIAPRAATPVAASQSKTWDIVIALFAERNLPIKNMDRASGFIATDPLGVDYAKHTGVDCGANVLHAPYYPRLASYSVFVGGDSRSSTVKAAVHWTSQTEDKQKLQIECTTQGQWETAFEQDVKTGAEGR